MATNPIYNQPSPLTTSHIVQNSFYESNPNGDTAIYEQIGSKSATLESSLASDDATSSITANVAYAPGRNKKQECIDNPLYAITTDKSSENPPIYSVPQPADPTRNEGKNSYAPLSNSSTPSHTSITTPPPAASSKSHESFELLERKLRVGDKVAPVSGFDGHYATPTLAATGPGGKEGSAKYNKLQHHAETTEKPKPVRLAMESSAGYQVLEKN